MTELLVDARGGHGGAIPDSLRTALRAAVRRALVVTAALVAAYVAGGVAADLTEPEPTPAVTRPDPAVAMMAEHRCTTGLPRGETPASALIRTADGELLQVSFDRGRRVQQGGEPGVLVAVCRGPLR